MPKDQDINWKLIILAVLGIIIFLCTISLLLNTGSSFIESLIVSLIVGIGIPGLLYSNKVPDLDEE